MTRNTAQNGFASSSGGDEQLATGIELAMSPHMQRLNNLIWYFINGANGSGAFVDHDMDGAAPVRQRRSRPRGAAAAAGRDLDALQVRVSSIAFYVHLEETS